MSEKRRKNAESASHQVRRCQVLFVLGSGFAPSEYASVLLDEFRADAGAGFDFSRAKPVILEAERWPSHDKEAFQQIVMSSVVHWFVEHDRPFDETRLVIRDYQDDSDRQYAVAGFFPRSEDGPEQDEPLKSQARDDDDSEAEPVIELDEGRAAGEKHSHKKHRHRKKKHRGGMPWQQWLARAKERTQSLRPLLEQAGSKLRRVPKKWLIAAGVLVGLMIVGVIVGPSVAEFAEQQWTAFNQTTEEASPDDADPDDSKPETPEKGDGRKLAPQKFTLGVVRVFTPEPGFFVAVDGQPVRDLDGQLITTPCAVTTEVGTHRLTVFREKWVDASRAVNVTLDTEAEFEPQADEKEIGSEMLTAPLLTAAVGQAIPMKHINSARPEIDPFVTPDGLTLWFAGDRKEGRGLFVSTRPSPFHDFEEPKIVSRSADMIASPSITSDELLIVYAVPEKARLMQLNRNSTKTDFNDKKLLRESDKDGLLWLSAQVLSDSKRMYWAELNDDTYFTYSLSRKNAAAKWEKLLKVALPGVHPCLSADGLRQYELRETKLLRHRRSSLQSKFGSDVEEIAELDLDGFFRSEDHRQFCVSADEQWLYYCDDPTEGGDLYVVRLSDGPQWGVKPTGKSISPKAKVIAKTDMPGDGVSTPDATETKPEPKPDKPAPKPVDPRTLPLPYASHLIAFNSLLSERKYDEATALLETAKLNPEFDAFKLPLSWDEQELGLIKAFWDDLRQIVSKMSAGDPIRINSNAMQLVSFVDGVITAKKGPSELKRNLTELTPADLSTIFDAVHKDDGPEPQSRFAAFMLHDKQAVERTTKLRIEKSGPIGAEMVDHRARRVLLLARAEFDRKNYGNGVGFLKTLRDLSTVGADMLKEADELQALLYSLVKWNPKGKREWIIKDGTYQASMQRFENSILMSSEQFENFEISFEFLLDVAVQAQGGVYFHYPGNGDLYEKSYKLHVANDFGVRPDLYSTGSLYAITRATENTIKKPGEWNTLRIRVQSEKIVAILNGKEIQKADLGDPKVPKQGFVCLDGGIGGITYRNVLLTELPAK